MSCCGNRKRLNINTKLPPITKQFGNLVLSLANVIAHAVKSGKVIADNSTIETRVNICKGCRHLIQSRCSICGCFITLKAGLKAEHCPLKNW